MLGIPRHVQEQMAHHARRGLPFEACGLLGGVSGGSGVEDVRSAKTFYPMTNVDQSPIHYALDPKEQFQVMKQMREKKEVLVGIFHSHVASPARPSAEDIRLAYYPGVSYILVSLSKDPPEFRSYTIEGGEVREEKIGTGS